MSDPERLLREDARGSIADNGFTARVMGALPARAAKPGPWLRPGLVLGSALLGSMLAGAFAPGGVTLLQGLDDLAGWRAFTPAALTALGMAGALLASALVLSFDSD